MQFFSIPLLLPLLSTNILRRQMNVTESNFTLLRCAVR